MAEMLIGATGLAKRMHSHKEELMAIRQLQANAVETDTCQNAGCQNTASQIQGART